MFLKPVVKISITCYEFQGYKRSSQVSLQTLTLHCSVVTMQHWIHFTEKASYLKARYLIFLCSYFLASNKTRETSPHSRIFFHYALGMLDMTCKSFLKFHHMLHAGGYTARLVTVYLSLRLMESLLMEHRVGRQWEIAWSYRETLPSQYPKQNSWQERVTCASQEQGLVWEDTFWEFWQMK